MSQKYKAAVIGVGKVTNVFQKGGGHAIGHTHAKMFKRSPRIELIAGADISRENLDVYLKTFDVPHGFESAEAMLAEAKPDIVSIGTYVGLHRRFIELCSRAGVKAILCEKPLLNSPADVAPVREVVEAHGVKLVVGHMRRYRPALQRVAQLIRDGAIGQPILYTWSVADWDLQEMGAHWVDLIRMYHGDKPVRHVFGQARVRDTRGYGHRMEDHSLAYWEFEDGARGLIDAGRALPGEHNTLIVGTAGTIRIKHENTVVHQTASGETTEAFGTQPPVGWEKTGVSSEALPGLAVWDMLLHELIQWIEGGAEPGVSMSNAMKTQEICFAAYVSALRRDRVDLPLSADEIAEYPIEAIAKANGIAG